MGGRRALAVFRANRVKSVTLTRQAFAARDLSDALGAPFASLNA
jgi:hypothetical protein